MECKGTETWAYQGKATVVSLLDWFVVSVSTILAIAFLIDLIST